MARTRQSFGSLLRLSVATAFLFPAGALVGATFTVINTSVSGPGSLRQAILDANGAAGADTIAFNIPGGGVHTISTNSALPTISESVTIDGYTQPGSSVNTLAVGNDAVLLIEIDGSGAGTNQAGLRVNAGTSTIRGLVINRFGGLSGSGIRLQAGTGHRVEGNFIGTDPTGTLARGNGSEGIRALSTATAVTIGGSTPDKRNLISANGIPGSDQSGIVIDSNDSFVQGNYIGTNAAGSAALGNLYAGVWVQGSNCVVGGAATPSGTPPGNLVSGNGLYGVFIDGVSSANSTKVQGNAIGTNATGVAAIPNTGTGVSSLGVAGTKVGGTAPGEGNLISGNTAGVEDSFLGVVIQGNKIGTDLSGVNPLGNEFGGVFLYDSSTNVTIGGTSPGAGNIIAYNNTSNTVGFGGVVVQGLSTTTRSILANRIHANQELGIDRGVDGVTPNQPGNGNNYPVVTSAVSKGGTTTIQGSLNSKINTMNIRIEFFSNAACDSSGYGEGATFAGATSVNTDGSGNASFSVGLPISIPLGSFVTATATATGSNTSEFSLCRIVTDVFPTATPTPTSTNTPPITPTPTPTPTTTPGPQVLGIAPASGPAAGGTPVTVSGTGFLPGASLTIGGVMAENVVIVGSAEITATTPALSPGSLNDVTVADPLAARAPRRRSASGTLPGGWLADFLDVPQGDIFHAHVEKVFRNGLTAGCGSGNYCRDNPVRRDQMAVFLLKAERGASYLPPACTPPGTFPDVPCPGPFTDWVEQLWGEGITGGCGGGNYCPADPVRRDQMAVFLLKAKHGSGYTPPACTGIFDDVACPGAFAVDWIEQLSIEGVTAGCSPVPPLYCPLNPNTRGQMAVFLVKTFLLP